MILICAWLLFLYKCVVFNLILILGRGVPETIKNANSRVTPLEENLVPDGDEALEIYEMTYSSRLTERSLFREDPLSHNENLEEKRGGIRNNLQRQRCL